MKVLPKREFRELAEEQRFTGVDTTIGFIDKYTLEPVVLEGQSTSIKLHELGHEKADHFSRAVKFYGRGRKDVTLMRHPWRQMVDDEIEAEIYSFRLRGKELTPRVGLMALRTLLDEGWEPSRALSLVIGRLRHYGIETSWKERVDLVRILERARGIELKEL